MMMRPVLAILTLSVWSCFLHPVSAASYSNPLRTYQGGDPDIIYDQGYYYFMSTQAVDITMTRATTLEGLKTGETKEVWADSTPSRCCAMWAPELHYIEGAWHIYYSAGPRPLGEQRSHVLVGGDSPWDTYSYLGQMQTPGYAIDGTLLALNNQNYFVYSGKQNGSDQSLYIAPLESAAVIGTPNLLSAPEEEWETQGGPINEGPHALYYGDKTFLTFSASSCATPSYALGLLTYVSGDPLQSSSWTKTGPVFSSANGNYGPGHNSFFTSPDGSEIWNVYHSTPNASGNCDTNRYSNALKMQFDYDGTPDFGSPSAYGTVLEGPSGEPGNTTLSGFIENSSSSSGMLQ